jgi:[ribosomal protein S18]-alanine N-acetyltransferase
MPHQAILREMLASDAEAIDRLIAVSPEAGQWSAAGFFSSESQGVVVRIAENHGAILGMVAVRMVAAEAEILNVAVSPEFRRQGIGQLLIDYALAEARSAGAKKVFLEVRESNVAARALYARLGFSEAGRRRGYYRNPVEDALLLSLSLV